MANKPGTTSFRIAGRILNKVRRVANREGRMLSRQIELLLERALQKENMHA